MSRRKKGKKKYSLYAFELNDENIALVSACRFYRITADYILLYECNQRFTNYNAIGNSELSYLTYADKRWLLDCNMAIIAEETERQKDKIANSMGLMIDKLEQALREERLKEDQNVGQSES